MRALIIGPKNEKEVNNDFWTQNILIPNIGRVIEVEVHQHDFDTYKGKIGDTWWAWHSSWLKILEGG